MHGNRTPARALDLDSSQTKTAPSPEKSSAKRAGDRTKDRSQMTSNGTEGRKVENPGDGKTIEDALRAAAAEWGEGGDCGKLRSDLLAILTDLECRG